MTISDVCLLGTLIVSVIALCYQVFGNKKVIFLFTYINKKENNRPNFEAPAVVF